MNQGRRVEDLHQRCAAIGTFINLTGSLSGQKDNDRPDSFSLLSDDISCDGIDELYVRTERLSKIEIELFECRFDRFFNSIETDGRAHSPFGFFCAKEDIMMLTS